MLTDAQAIFVLTTGGHDVGIVFEIGPDRHSYQVMTRPAEGRYVDPDTWLAGSTARGWFVVA